MTVKLDSHEIIEINKQAITCISTALLTLGEGEKKLNTSPVVTFNRAAYNEIADLVERQNLLINKFICKSPLA